MLQVTKQIPECGHEVEVMCPVIPMQSACKAKCERTLKCGHKCKGMCKDNCDESKCREMVESCEMPMCGHPITMVPCCENKKGSLYVNTFVFVCVCGHMELLKNK